MLNPRTIDAPFALAPSEPRVARHALAERLFHWILAASFLILIVSRLRADPRLEVRIGSRLTGLRES